MSKITLAPNAAGTGIFTVAAPGTSTDRTLTLPDATTTLVGTDATQTLTNKTIQGGTLGVGTAVASTSGTSIDFTGIPSWAKRVTILLAEVSTNGTSAVQVQIGNTTFTTTGYISTAQQSGAALSSTTGFIVGGSAATDARSGAVVLHNITGNQWIASGTNKGSTGNAWAFGGSVTIGAALDRVRITTVNGTDTFDAGTINIMWEG